MSEKLLPCPFCGNTNIVIRPNNIGDFYALCTNDLEYPHCGATSSDANCETPEGAIRRWNTRYSQGGQADVRRDGADEAMKKIWADWFAFYSNHFRASGITISMADQMAFYEIAQPILRALASPPPSASQASCSPPRKDGQ